VNPRNLLGEWARLLVGSLARAGVRDVVLSPGSRSTPFAWAALREHELTCHTLIDERSAGFFALGQARLSGRPSLLVCTSGSAGAHYLPALVEARQAFLPLIVLTADRPFELQDCAAAQTIDQTRLFGDHAKKYVELGEPDADPSALRALARKASQAVHAARWPEPGPVHLNARARKPLEPQPATSESERALRTSVSALLERGPTLAASGDVSPDPAAIAAVAHACRDARRGLLVCGALPASRSDQAAAVTELALALGFPLLCEAPSQLRLALPDVRLESLVCDAFDLLLGASALDPDLVVELGPPLTSGALERHLAAHPELERHVIAPFGWPDPASSARTLLAANLAAGASALRAALGTDFDRERSAGWRATVSTLNALAWRSIEAELAKNGLSEGVAVRAVVDSLAPGAVLVVGNSLPVREVDQFCRARAGGVRVSCQRGANGIDGLISGAAGAALAARAPTTLLIGDVSFLHDVGGLLAARAVETPLVIVVLNNDGGRIFEQLPLAALPEVGENELLSWITPHGLELKHAAALYGHAYAKITLREELESALRSARERAGCSVIEVIVPPHGARDLARRIHERFRSELRADADARGVSR
jgi:2-succinyl-5-enolpyruvyl-6-hydroxy-3-cyclohexene-1-carboxylate synthase